MHLSFYTLGCKLNWAETEELQKKLMACGHTAVPFLTTETIAIIRACGVTTNASQTTRTIIRRAKKAGKIIIALGCLENAHLPEIDYHLHTISAVIKTINNLTPSKIIPNNEPKNTTQRTRSFVKIQTGCNFACAYCVIPHFRGKNKSIPIKQIIKKIKILEKNNFHEIVLTGVNIGLYRDGTADLATLLQNILKKTTIERIRLGSLDPRLITPALIKLYPHARLMPHWHLSLQSGTDTVLQRMRRGYTTAQFFSIIQKIRTRAPLFAFTTDIIIGFPGETETEFLTTKKFLKKIGFSQMHLFPFSARPNTPAANMTNFIPDQIKKNRCLTLAQIAARSRQAYKNNFIGKESLVLFENKRRGLWEGYTPEYLRVRLSAKKNLHNQIITLTLNRKNLKSN